MQRLKSLIAGALTGAVMIATAAIAADHATIIDYRKGHLMAMGGHISALKGMVFADAPTHRLQMHADSLVILTKALNDELDQLFPPGSGDGKTKAKASAWSDREGFKAAAAKAAEAADGFAAAVASGDKAAMGGAFKQLGGSCKGCHDDYRSR